MIRIEVEGGDGNTYIFTYDPTFHEQEGIIESTIKFGRQTVFGFHAPLEMTDNEIQAKVTGMMPERGKSFATLHPLDKPKRISRSLTIDDNETTVTFEEVLNMCEEYVQALENIVRAAKSRFDS